MIEIEFWVNFTAKLKHIYENVALNYKTEKTMTLAQNRKIFSLSLKLKIYINPKIKKKECRNEFHP